jgi:hypothetical protein
LGAYKTADGTARRFFIDTFADMAADGSALLLLGVGHAAFRLRDREHSRTTAM